MAQTGMMGPRVYTKLITLYALNMDSFLYVNHTLIRWLCLKKCHCLQRKVAPECQPWQELLD